MMTYVKLISNENGFVTYEYGKDKDNMIGTVTVEINNTDNVVFKYYKISPIKKFCTSTGHTVTLIFRFIKENSFPDEYVYAC